MAGRCAHVPRLDDGALARVEHLQPLERARLARVLFLDAGDHLLRRRRRPRPACRRPARRSSRPRGASSDTSRPVSRGVIVSMSSRSTPSAVASELARRRLSLALELAARAPEAEEDLALRARGADAHRPVRAHHVLEHAGANPVGGVGRQARGAPRIEAARRDGQARGCPPGSGPPWTGPSGGTPWRCGSPGRGAPRPGAPAPSSSSRVRQRRDSRCSSSTESGPSRGGSGARFHLVPVLGQGHGPPPISGSRSGRGAALLELRRSSAAAAPPTEPCRTTAATRSRGRRARRARARWLRENSPPRAESRRRTPTPTVASGALGQRVRRVRGSRRLSRERLAHHVRVAADTLAGFERRISSCLRSIQRQLPIEPSATAAPSREAADQCRQSRDASGAARRVDRSRRAQVDAIQRLTVSRQHASERCSPARRVDSVQRCVPRVTDPSVRPACVTPLVRTVQRVPGAGAGVTIDAVDSRCERRRQRQSL